MNRLENITPLKKGIQLWLIKSTFIIKIKQKHTFVGKRLIRIKHVNQNLIQLKRYIAMANKKYFHNKNKSEACNLWKQISGKLRINQDRIELANQFF